MVIYTLDKCCDIQAIKSPYNFIRSKLFTRKGSDIVSSNRFSFATIYADINKALDVLAIQRLGNFVTN